MSGIELLDADEQFFADHPRRKVRIRVPRPGESEGEFRTLGPHLYERRRMIVARVPALQAQRYGVKLMHIPFLAFADETIEDTDEVLLPILDGIMRTAAAECGLPPRRR